MNLPTAAPASAPVLWLEELDALPDATFRLVSARIAWPDDGESEGLGRDEDPALAQLKALAEAVERQACVRLPASAVYGPAPPDCDTLLPDTLVRYTEAQYALPGFPCVRFDPRVPRWWLPARSALGEDVRQVAADFACGPQAFAPAYRERMLGRVTSSGSASGASLGEAVQRAVLELVERDAFMRHWFAQAPGRSVELSSLPSWAAARLRVLTDEGCRAGVQCLERGMHPTWLAWAQHEALHFTCVGAASGLDAEAALRSALGELDTQALARLAGVPPVPIAPGAVRTPGDHGALYATPDHFRAADALLLTTESVRYEAIAESFGLTPDALYTRMAAAGHAPWWVDLSLPEAAELLEGAPLHTVRAVAPGLIPIAFGCKLQPLGMVDAIAEGGRLLHPFS